MTTQDIVAKLWSLCHVLRDDGITYHQYVTELTYLLFLKMLKETAQEELLPKGYRWDDLLSRTDNVERHTFYRSLLVYLGTHGGSRVKAIFTNAATSLRQPKNLAKLIQDIDALDWYDAKKEGLGDLYEGLLQKNADEKKSGAGQYFTPRPLIECMVVLTQPKPGEVIQDPALGTGGFLIAADAFIKKNTDELFSLPERQQVFQRRQAFVGIELVEDAHRLALMNAMLHGIESNWMLGDALSPDGQSIGKADLILTNPPFGTKKGGGLPTRDDFTFPTSNKQLAFVQHIYRGLKPGGRAAVVLPDNVLFEDGIGVDHASTPSESVKASISLRAVRSFAVIRDASSSGGGRSAALVAFSSRSQEMSRLSPRWAMASRVNLRKRPSSPWSFRLAFPSGSEP